MARLARAVRLHRPALAGLRASSLALPAFQVRESPRLRMHLPNLLVTLDVEISHFLPRWRPHKWAMPISRTSCPVCSQASTSRHTNTERRPRIPRVLAVSRRISRCWFAISIRFCPLVLYSPLRSGRVVSGGVVGGVGGGCGGPGGKHSRVGGYLRRKAFQRLVLGSSCLRGI
jgi:hypothetical protein